MEQAKTTKFLKEDLKRHLRLRMLKSGGDPKITIILEWVNDPSVPDYAQEIETLTEDYIYLD